MKFILPSSYGILSTKKQKEKKYDDNDKKKAPKSKEIKADALVDRDYEIKVKLNFPFMVDVHR